MYPNMSYCMCQNTLMAMQQILDSMQDQGSDFASDLSREELAAYHDLTEVCAAFIAAAQDLEDSA